MKNNMFFKNNKAERQRLINQWKLNLETMYSCIVEVCGKEKATEVAELIRKRVKLI